MEESVLKTLVIGPAFAAEQFIAEHLFFYLVDGKLTGRYGDNIYSLAMGECGILRKNQLGRYLNEQEASRVTKVIFVLDQVFLKVFQEKYALKSKPYFSTDTFIRIAPDTLLKTFINSLSHYHFDGQISKSFFDLKREELLLILLQRHPELSGLLFDYGIPGKIDLDNFMNRNYRYNVNIDRLAFLSGRSLSTFKRDFKTTFQDTPHRWLLNKRLTEARHLIQYEKKKPVEIFADLGFEDLSHFCYAFKRQFGKSPNR